MESLPLWLVVCLLDYPFILQMSEKVLDESLFRQYNGYIIKREKGYHMSWIYLVVVLGLVVLGLAQLPAIGGFMFVLVQIFGGGAFIGWLAYHILP